MESRARPSPRVVTEALAQLSRQRREERLRHRGVVAVVAAGHAAIEAVLAQDLLAVVASVRGCPDRYGAGAPQQDGTAGAPRSTSAWNKPSSRAYSCTPNPRRDQQPLHPAPSPDRLVRTPSQRYRSSLRGLSSRVPAARQTPPRDHQPLHTAPSSVAPYPTAGCDLSSSRGRRDACIRAPTPRRTHQRPTHKVQPEVFGPIRRDAIARARAHVFAVQPYAGTASKNHRLQTRRARILSCASAA